MYRIILSIRMLWEDCVSGLGIVGTNHELRFQSFHMPGPVSVGVENFAVHPATLSCWDPVNCILSPFQATLPINLVLT